MAIPGFAMLYPRDGIPRDFAPQVVRGQFLESFQLSAKPRCGGTVVVAES
jgi:hypothetical protein